jgi:enoyl-CoA hydratase
MKTTHPALSGQIDDAGVLVVAIDDGKANALSPDLVTALRAVAAEAANDARALVLYGRPGRMSAGFDLSVMTSSVEAMRALVGDGAELLLDLFTSPVPVVIGCTGHALAAGALLLLAADRRVGAAIDCKIGLNEVAIGMALPIFAVELARYRMPPSHFDAATVYATIYDPNGAVAAGYLDAVVPADDVVSTAVAHGRTLAELRSGAVRRTKELARGPVVDRIRATLAADMAGLGPPAA